MQNIPLDIEIIYGEKSYISPNKEKINIYYGLNEEFVAGDKYFKIHTTKKEMANDAEVFQKEKNEGEKLEKETKKNEDLEIIQLDFKDEIQSIYVYENKLYGFKYENKSYSFKKEQDEGNMIVYDISDLKNIKKVTELKLENSRYTDWINSYIYKENIYILRSIDFEKKDNKFEDGILLNDYTINGKQEKVNGDNIYLNPDKDFGTCFKIIKFNMNDQKADSFTCLSNMRSNLEIKNNTLKMYSIFSINNRNFRYYLKDRIFNPFGLLNDKDGENKNFKVAVYDLDLENFNLKEINKSTLDEFENQKLTDPFDVFKYFSGVETRYQFTDKISDNLENKEKYLKLAKTNPKIFPIQKVEKIGKDKIFTYSIKKPRILKENVYQLYLNLFETNGEDFILIDQKKFYIEKKIDKKAEESEETREYDEYSEYKEDQYIRDVLEDINVEVVDDYIFLSIFNLRPYEEDIITREIKLTFKNNRTNESFSIETDKGEISVLVFEINGSKIKARTYLTEKMENENEKYNNENEELSEEEYERHEKKPLNIIFKDGKIFFRNNKKIIVLDINDLKIYNYNL